MSLRDLADLHSWLQNRQPMLDECQTWIAKGHLGDSWPDFRQAGCEYDVQKKWIRPKFEGVPIGSFNAGGGDGPDRPTLVELAARTTAIRSRRWDGARVRELPDSWPAIVRSTFPFLCTMEINAGWGDLIIAASAWIAETGDISGWSSSQIKEKFATLRWYPSGYPSDRTLEIIEAAEWLSGSMCEMCGAPGRRRSGGWISTLCDQHAK